MSSTQPARPTIREMLAGQPLRPSTSGMTERDVAELLSAVGPLSSSLFLGSMRAGRALGSALGIQSAKRASRAFTAPYASVVLALALALRQQGREMTALYDTPRGATIEATLPNDAFSLGGQLAFEVVDGGAAGATIEGASVINGQSFDWGKGKRALTAVLDSTQQYLQRLGS